MPLNVRIELRDRPGCLEDHVEEQEDRVRLTIMDGEDVGCPIKVSLFDE